MIFLHSVIRVCHLAVAAVDCGGLKKNGVECNGSTGVKCLQSDGKSPLVLGDGYRRVV